jgi:hypothetical protein
MRSLDVVMDAAAATPSKSLARIERKRPFVGVN